MLKLENRTGRLIIYEMHRTLLRTILTIFSIFAQTGLGFSQAKPSVEIDVTKCWSYPTGELRTNVLATHGDRLIAGFAGAEVVSLASDGKKVWSTEFGGEIRSNILALDSGIFVITSTTPKEMPASGGSVLRALSKETGIPTWTLKLPESNRHFIGAFGGSLVVVSDCGVIESIDAKTGIVKWRREIATGFAVEPVFAAESLTVAAVGNQIFKLLPVSGEIDSMTKVPFSVTALGRTGTGALVIGDDRGNISLLVNGSDKPYWKFKSGGEISSVYPIGDNILAASHDNFVYVLVSRNGGLDWKKRLAGRVSAVGSVMDKYVLLSSFEEHGAVLSDIADGKAVGRISFGGDESIDARPVSSNSLIFIPTNEAIHAYSLAGCQQNDKGGAGK